MRKGFDEADPKKSARELIDRHGQAAAEIAGERVAELEARQAWPEHAIAVRVLNEVERSVGNGKGGGA